MLVVEFWAAYHKILKYSIFWGTFSSYVNWLGHICLLTRENCHILIYDLKVMLTKMLLIQTTIKFAYPKNNEIVKIWGTF